MILPAENVVIERCDVIEHNHFYDEKGKLVFDQLIFYDWDPWEARFQVRDWRLVKSFNQVPLKDAMRGGYTVTWHDGQILRRVSAPSTYESWTQYDPELHARSFKPKENRQELRRARQVKIVEESIQASRNVP